MLSYVRDLGNPAPYQYKIKTIPDGLAGTRATVANMRTLVKAGTENPEIRRLATEIVKEVPEKNRAAEAAALLDYVKTAVRYTRDPVELELLTPPEKLIQVGHGDCDDMAILLASLLRAIGIKSRFALISTRRSGPYQHIFVEAQTSRGWMALDPTVKEKPPGWSPPGYVRRMAVSI